MIMDIFTIAIPLFITAIVEDMDAFTIIMDSMQIAAPPGTVVCVVNMP
jgi:hypothetical protein